MSPVILLAIILLTGCESGQFSDCQQENITLNTEIKQLNETSTQQDKEIKMLKESIDEYLDLVMNMTVLLESGKTEIERLRRDVAELKKP